MVHPDNVPLELSTLDAKVIIKEKMIDVGDEFRGTKDFDDRESMITWIRRCAIRKGFSMVVGRSDNGTVRRKPFVTFLCEKCGKYNPPLRKLKKDDTGTRKCECPFKLCCYKLASMKWKCHVVCGSHNHNLYAKLQGHSMACRLNPAEKESIKEMSLNFVQPKNILAALKRKQLDNISNIKQRYNERLRNRKAKWGDRSEIQQLFKLLDDKKYLVNVRNCDDDVTVRDIFWTHPDLVNLFNTFSTVLILDSTYKTNKYQFPLFEMVGVTSTDMTFAVGFAFLECEKEGNFRWALEVCRSLLKKQVDMPRAIVMDCNNALMNVVAKVFPTSVALLCQYHISCNVRIKVKPTVETKQVATEGGKAVKLGVIVDGIMDVWVCIINSSTQEMYVDTGLQFQKICEKYPELLKYVEETILDKVKEKIICVWTDKDRHLGNTTTNRVESAHATLKNWLCDSNRLSNIDKTSNADKSKLESLIDLAGTCSFDVFI